MKTYYTKIAKMAVSSSCLYTSKVFTLGNESKNNLVSTQVKLDWTDFKRTLMVVAHKPIGVKNQP